MLLRTDERLTPETSTWQYFYYSDLTLTNLLDNKSSSATMSFRFAILDFRLTMTTEQEVFKPIAKRINARKTSVKKKQYSHLTIRTRTLKEADPAMFFAVQT